MSVLREVQQRFMRGVLDGIAVADVTPPAALSIYANNARVVFMQTLQLTYPAVCRLVGDDYFRQCAREFHRLYPSRSGDLQHVGAGFSGYLEVLHGTDRFEYLAHVARLEWAYQEALIESERAPLDLQRLAAVVPGDYPNLRFRLQPSARLVESNFPILAIWQANVTDEAAGQERIDLGAGADLILLVRAFQGVRVHRLTTGEHCFLTRLLTRDPFCAAVEAASAADAAFNPIASLQKFVALRAIVDFHL
jgi:hypothetical protein